MTQVELDPQEKLVPGQLLDVVFTTQLGAKYSFPDMDQKHTFSLVAALTRGVALTQITLVNVSGACLVLPTRIIQSIRGYTNLEEPPVTEWERPK